MMDRAFAAWRDMQSHVETVLGWLMIAGVVALFGVLIWAWIFAVQHGLV